MRIKFILLSIFSLVSFAHAKEREITVSGTCNREVVSDRGYLVLTAEAEEKEIKPAVKKALQTYERVLEAIKKLKLADENLETVEYSVNSINEWERNKTVFKGFRARMGLKISSSDIQRLGEVIEIAAKENVRQVGQLNSYISPDKVKVEQEACLKEAAESARRKAEKLAKALGASVGQALVVSESGEGGNQPIFYAQTRAAMATDSMESSGAPAVQAGRQNLSATVQVTFQLQ